MIERQFYVCILSNKGNSVLYNGVTNDLKRRVYEHRTKAVPGFTARLYVSSYVSECVSDRPPLGFEPVL
ncbi:MAG: GIY-YIG nuclease family protein [Thermodesulfobacteriota bacterium]